MSIANKDEDLGFDLSAMLNDIRAKEMAAARQQQKESKVMLRDPGEARLAAPGSPTNPTFFLTPSEGYHHMRDTGKVPTSDLSLAASKAFQDAMREAAQASHPTQREAAVARGASAVAKDWDQKNGNHSGLAAFRQEARGQIAFAARELGLGPAESKVVGYAVERALEKEGFRVMANHAIDKVSDMYSATKSSLASSITHKAELNKELSKSMTWLKTHGVDKEAVKGFVNQHAGKLLILSELATNPVMQDRVMLAVRNSDSVVDGLLMLKNDKEFRQALGTLAVGTGEATGLAHKGAASLLILGGSVLRDDPPSDTGRHMFRAALSLAGGAVAGVGLGAMTGGLGGLAGAAAGSYAGGYVADALLAAYDKYTGVESKNEFAGNLQAHEVRESATILSDRMQRAGHGPASGLLAGKGLEMDSSEAKSPLKDRGLEREGSSLELEYAKKLG